MSVNINASTTNGLVLTSDTSGELKLQANGTDIATVSSSGITMASGKTLSAAALTGTLPAIDGSSLTGVGKILQVVQTVKTNTFSATTSTYVDVTGLSVSITPTNSSNKVLVLVDLNWAASALDINTCRLLRDSTVIGAGDASGSRGTGFAGMRTASADNIVTNSISFLDSPSTTSATTYKIQIKSGGSPNTVLVNRTSTDTNSFAFPRVVSSITVMEVAG